MIAYSGTPINIPINPSSSPIINRMKIIETGCTFNRRPITFGSTTFLSTNWLTTHTMTSFTTMKNEAPNAMQMAGRKVSVGPKCGMKDIIKGVKTAASIVTIGFSIKFNCEYKRNVRATKIKAPYGNTIFFPPKNSSTLFVFPSCHTTSSVLDRITCNFMYRKKANCTKIGNWLLLYSS